eukprot:760258-Hanusia_phi.AAC.2
MSGTSDNLQSSETEVQSTHLAMYIHDRKQKQQQALSIELLTLQARLQTTTSRACQLNFDCWLNSYDARKFLQHSPLGRPSPIHRIPFTRAWPWGGLPLLCHEPVI